MDALARKVMSKHGLSLEAARKHRAKQMPQRVVDPTSRLGFRRAEQGETESCEPYPLALGSLGDVFLSLDSFGLGVSLYFRQLAWIFCVVFACAMILCPSTTHNASACHHGDDTTTKPAYENAGLARGTASGCVVGDLSVGLNVAPDAVWKSTTGLGGPGQTSELSISIKSKSIRLTFGRIDCSRRVLEA